MIGLVSSVLAAVILKNPAFLLVIPAYIIRMKSKNWALIAFYVYLVILAIELPNESVYKFAGLKLAVVAGIAVFLALDEVLRGVRFDTEAVVISGILIGSALNDYAFMGALIAVAFYTAYKNFGRALAYLAGWAGVLMLFLYLARDRLSEPGGQTLAIIGLGLVFLLFAERKDVEFLEVGLFEED